MSMIAWIGLAASALIALGIAAGLVKLQRRMLGAAPAPGPAQLSAERADAGLPDAGLPVEGGDDQPRRLEADG